MTCLSTLNTRTCASLKDICCGDVRVIHLTRMRRDGAPSATYPGVHFALLRNQSRLLWHHNVQMFLKDRYDSCTVSRTDALMHYGTYSCGPSSSMPAINRATPNGRLIMASSSCTLSPKRRARSHTACVTLSTLMRSS